MAVSYEAQASANAVATTQSWSESWRRPTRSAMSGGPDPFGEANNLRLARFGPWWALRDRRAHCLRCRAASRGAKRAASGPRSPPSHSVAASLCRAASRFRRSRLSSRCEAARTQRSCCSLTWKPMARASTLPSQPSWAKAVAPSRRRTFLGDVARAASINGAPFERRALFEARDEPAKAQHLEAKKKQSWPASSPSVCAATRSRQTALFKRFCSERSSCRCRWRSVSMCLTSIATRAEPLTRAWTQSSSRAEWPRSTPSSRRQADLTRATLSCSAKFVASPTSLLAVSSERPKRRLVATSACRCVAAAECSMPARSPASKPSRCRASRSASLRLAVL
mmetsp:Transcript_24563/g.84050  ORF Transcript_24563/g.84050 Transcript_24563/m.84050 type:complete len:338 (-) Transcript_24563:2429-3442(-)